MKSSEHFSNLDIRNSGEDDNVFEEECDEKDDSCLNLDKKKELFSE